MILYIQLIPLRNFLIFPQATNLMKKGGFNLRKWASNCVKLLSRVEFKCDSIDYNNIKVLGMRWFPLDDTILPKSNSVNLQTDQITKRNVLSFTAAVFDPLGLFLQNLISKGIDWEQFVNIANDCLPLQRLVQNHQYDQMFIEIYWHAIMLMVLVLMLASRTIHMES